ncbi:ACT domain-containing protein [Desulfovibrio sp. OttesenSCG-928-I05]|nr:ACT domain-containing protein [Desulfovibrio sp. OttesenSCG-928-I05]
MKVEQISVFLENKAGRLAEVTNVLSAANINIRALSLADTSEFGILRLIVDDHEKAKAALKENDFTVGLTSVVALEVPHKPGGLNSILQLLGLKGINVEYMYACWLNNENAVLIFRFNRLDQALEVLKEEGVTILSNAVVCGS